MILTFVLFTPLGYGRQDYSKPGFPPARERSVLSPLPKVDPNKSDAPADDSWTIVLASVIVGEDAVQTRDALAQEALTRVQTKGGLPEAYTVVRGRAAVIVYGRYPSPDDPAAQKDLARVRATTVDGATPFADSYLSPPSSDAFKGSLPEYDLRNARSQFGPKRARYTLQVGVYGEADPRKPLPTAKELKEIRAAAEQAAVTLRREGELAFYYHGPSRSMVTIGLFNDADIDAKQPGGESQALRDLRQRQPNNLLNGKGLLEHIKADPDKAAKNAKGSTRLQASRLVAVPDS